MGGRVIHCEWSQRPTRLYRTITNVASVIESRGPYQAVHSHVLFASGTALAGAARAGVSVRVAHSHNTSTQSRGIASSVYQRYARWAIRASATEFMACTEEAGNYLFGKSYFKARGAKVINNAVDTAQFRPGTSAQRAAVRATLGVGQGSLLLVSIARMEAVKNHRFLIRVAHALAVRGVDFALLLVGDGRLRAELEETVSSLGIGSTVRFMGVRRDIAEILRAADMLLMPSHFEGLPVALVEAQATGLKCLVSDRISREADLGMGLLTFMPIDDPAHWAERACSGNDLAPICARDIARSLRRRGYVVEDAVAALLSLYGLQEGSAS